MELSDEEVGLLYRLFRAIQMLDHCPSDYTGRANGEDDDFYELRRKIKKHINEKGPEWMFGKNIPYWW